MPDIGPIDIRVTIDTLANMSEMAKKDLLRFYAIIYSTEYLQVYC